MGYNYQDLADILYLHDIYMKPQGGAFDCLGTAYEKLEMSGEYQNRHLCTQTIYHGGCWLSVNRRSSMQQSLNMNSTDLLNKTAHTPTHTFTDRQTLQEYTPLLKVDVHACELMSHKNI